MLFSKKNNHVIKLLCKQNYHATNLESTELDNQTFISSWHNFLQIFRPTDWGFKSESVLFIHDWLRRRNFNRGNLINWPEAACVYLTWQNYSPKWRHPNSNPLEFCIDLVKWKLTPPSGQCKPSPKQQDQHTKLFYNHIFLEMLIDLSYYVNASPPDDCMGIPEFFSILADNKFSNLKIQK